MNVFHKYTRQSLRRSPARTLVTVIGIVLSMSLFTAVIEGAYSGLQYLFRGETEVSGAWHGFYYGLDGETKDQVLADSAIADAATWRQVGWAGTGGSYYYSYLLIEEVSENFTDLLSVPLTEGRMPENKNEILLPIGLTGFYLPEGVEYKVGDVITLDVGRLLADGQDSDEVSYFSGYGELELADTAPRAYTVVGFYADLSGSVRTDKKIALTAGGGTGNWRVFFTLKSPKDIFTWFDSAPYGSGHEYHGNLLRYCGAFRSVGITEVLYGFAGVLVFLISFGSISLIYNSFSISVSERTRQFGLLKSVGATKKQIRGAVLYEALLLSAVGIPVGLIVGCTGIGITLWALRDFFNALFAAGDGLTTRIGLVPAPGPLALSAAICLMTVLISAWVPAQRAIRLTAIDAIRQSVDVKVEPDEVTVSPITLKLFGFEGVMAAKNFKRSRKRYRSTIFSLFLSVTLFISASSLCAYITDTVEAMASGESWEDLRYVRHMDEGEDPDAALAQLTGVEGVTEGLYYDWASIGMWVYSPLISEEFRRVQNDPTTPVLLEDNGWIYMGVAQIFLDDATFRQLCADHGIDPADFFDADAPAALFYNHYTTTVSLDKGSRWISWEIYDPSAFPATVREQSLIEIDGYVLAYTAPDPESGEILCYYFPQDYYDAHLAAPYGGDLLSMDKSVAIVLTEEEATQNIEHRALAAIDQVPFALVSNAPKLLYPYSMMEAVIGEKEVLDRNDWVIYAFLTSNHRLAYENMSALLKERGDAGNLYDAAEYGQRTRMMVVIVSVFAYGFIILISLIAAANVFNTISTNVSLRRREFAMLKSIGLSKRGFRKTLNCECMIYGLRGLLWGLPASAAMTYIIYRIAENVLTVGFYIPWYSVAIAVGSVFAVVFAAMLYSARKLRQDDLVEALKSENF